MTAISFKNVGEKIDVVKKRKQASIVSYPLGIVTPVRSGDDADGIFKMHYSLKDQIRDNFKNLLLTNHGDRVIACDFGANLKPLTFELTSQEDFDSEAMVRIKTAVSRYMPFIELVDFESKIEFPDVQQNVGNIALRINYSVSTASIAEDSITVIFFLGG